MKLRAVVVDDEELVRQRVRDLVDEHPALTLIGEARDGAEALDVIVAFRPDLVFLDIQMPELDGFQVVAALANDVLPAIVFVTAYDEYAIRAFEVDAIDYLLKPVTPERFAAAVARVTARTGLTDEARETAVHAFATGMARKQGYATRFAARRGGKHYFVRASEIEWVEAEGNYVRMRSGTTSHLIRETMKGVETRVDPAEFVRIHRSVIVAIDRILSIEAREQGEYLVVMADGRNFVSSRSYSDRVRALLRSQQY